MNNVDLCIITDIKHKDKEVVINLLKRPVAKTKEDPNNLNKTITNK